MEKEILEFRSTVETISFYLNQWLKVEEGLVNQIKDILKNLERDPESLVLDSLSVAKNYIKNELVLSYIFYEKPLEMQFIFKDYILTAVAIIDSLEDTSVCTHINLKNVGKSFKNNIYLENPLKMIDDLLTKYMGVSLCENNLKDAFSAFSYEDGLMLIPYEDFRLSNLRDSFDLAFNTEEYYANKELEEFIRNNKDKVFKGLV